MLIVAVIIICCMLYVHVGSKRIEQQMWQHLTEKGYHATDVQSVEIKHSFLNVILSYNEWTVRVVYRDEPDSFYLYTIKDGTLVESGRGGSIEDENFKH